MHLFGQTSSALQAKITIITNKNCSSHINQMNHENDDGTKVTMCSASKYMKDE